MKIKYLIVLLMILSVIVFGCTKTAGIDAMEKKNTTMEKSIYQGKVLAGTESTKYLDFNKADYDKALKEKKKILLYFYANWCPICRLEQPKTFAAFNEIKDADLIGFRINYRDSDTDADEEALAKEFGVSYQHTKVILKDGQRVLKAPDSWDKQRYLDELAKV
ncbi:thioredoxin family protein [Candidatus Woesearchaeota archaeon]|nr:thioredoxin family protein [Candidatus Woesearchaeota archaeon]